jgi:glutamate/aspartate transport system permease protein
MNYTWDWSVLFATPYFGYLLSGLMWTLLVAGAAWVLAFAWGSLLGIARTLDSPIIRALAATYVEVFRGVPLLLHFFIWYFVFPELLPEPWGLWVKQDLPAPEYVTSVVALGLYTAARVAEQVRSGIQALPKDLVNAGLAVGLTPRQNYLYVRLPVAFRIIIPPLTSEFLTIFKNSALALTIGVLELTARAREIQNMTFQGFEAYTAATVLYLGITLCVVLLMRAIDRRTRIPGFLEGRG